MQNVEWWARMVQKYPALAHTVNRVCMSEMSEMEEELNETEEFNRREYYAEERLPRH
jgi:hypothetical protein